MADLRELYQEMILDHGRQPRNVGELPSANHHKEGFNPLCGDKIALHVLEDNGVINDIRFEGCGCAISMASASLMTESIKGKTLAECNALFSEFHLLVTTGIADKKTLGKLAVLGGVHEFPARVKCASLAWHTLHAILTHDQSTISTE